MANRSVSLEGMIWAEGAPDLPTSPVQGTTYRDSSVTTPEINNAQPYGEKGDSSKFNELLYRFSVLVDLIERYGTLPWCPTVNYPTGAICMGSDGVPYRSVTTPNLNNDPVITSGYWAYAFESASSAETQAGVSQTKFVTPYGLLQTRASETQQGVIEIISSAGVIAGVDDERAVSALKLKEKLNNEIGLTSSSSWNTISLLSGWTGTARYRYLNNETCLQIDFDSLDPSSATGATLGATGISIDQTVKQSTITTTGDHFTILFSNTGTISIPSYSGLTGVLEEQIIIPVT